MSIYTCLYMYECVPTCDNQQARPSASQSSLWISTPTYLPTYLPTFRKFLILLYVKNALQIYLPTHLPTITRGYATQNNVIALHTYLPTSLPTYLAISSSYHRLHLRLACFPLALSLIQLLCRLNRITPPLPLPVLDPLSLRFPLLLLSISSRLLLLPPLSCC